MRRLAPILMTCILFATACGGEDPTLPAPTRPAGGSPAATGETPEAAGTKTAPGFPNVPIVDVEPELPGEGESTSIKLKVEGRATEPMDNNQRLQRPTVVLSRSPQEAAAVSNALPPGAAELVQSWGAYQKRSLVIALGGGQPDAGHRIDVESISVTMGGEVVSVFASIRRPQGAAGQVISVPWMAMSVRAGATVLAERCILALTGSSAIQSRCHGGS